MTALLETRGLSKTFGGLKAVQNVDLRVEANRVVSVIGPNGAGKTTFFNCLSGIYRPDSGGAILLDGRDVTGRPPHEICRLGLARTFQNIRLFPEMSVLENILVARFRRCRFFCTRRIFARKKRSAGPRRRSFSISSGSPDTPKPCRATSPTACNAGWRSPAPWPRNRACSSSMNRRRG